ncbi:MAG TPA: GlsB/YeaQ/YmgE family stress response membrane protein [bacterium]|nr:GlsB/YeaQ/YmgE family stress response membrane protein [bacterium]
MGILITILVGGVIGWLASLVMKTNAQQGALLNVIIGIAGAWLGRWLFGGILHIGGAHTAGGLSLYGILWGVLGAILLIAILKILNLLR